MASKDRIHLTIWKAGVLQLDASMDKEGEIAYASMGAPEAVGAPYTGMNPLAEYELERVKCCLEGSAQEEGTLHKAAGGRR